MVTRRGRELALPADTRKYSGLFCCADAGYRVTGGVVGAVFKGGTSRARDRTDVVPNPCFGWCLVVITFCSQGWGERDGQR